MLEIVKNPGINTKMVKNQISMLKIIKNPYINDKILSNPQILMLMPL